MIWYDFVILSRLEPDQLLRSSMEYKEFYVQVYSTDCLFDRIRCILRRLPLVLAQGFSSGDLQSKGTELWIALTWECWVSASNMYRLWHASSERQHMLMKRYHLNDFDLAMSNDISWRDMIDMCSVCETHTSLRWIWCVLMNQISGVVPQRPHMRRW